VLLVQRREAEAADLYLEVGCGLQYVCRVLQAAGLSHGGATTCARASGKGQGARGGEGSGEGKGCCGGEGEGRAAAIAAANAWHQGYVQQDYNVYWRWVQGDTCQDFAQYGCWHVEVITRNGCPSYVAVQANEYSGGTIINSLLDNQAFGIPPKTPRRFELDADQDGVTANNVTVTCS
jgi:hypothetical protein